MSEANSGSDVVSMKLRAVKKGFVSRFEKNVIII
jgi:hypothetical protein